MPYLSPPTLTRAEQAALLRVSGVQPRDQVIFSLALGTGLRLSEIVGLNVGDVFTATGTPRSRIRLRKEIVKGAMRTCERWPHLDGALRVLLAEDRPSASLRHALVREKARIEVGASGGEYSESQIAQPRG